MDKLEKVLRENSDVWKNKSAFMNYLRGGLRKFTLVKASYQDKTYQG